MRDGRSVECNFIRGRVSELCAKSRLDTTEMVSLRAITTESLTAATMGIIEETLGKSIIKLYTCIIIIILICSQQLSWNEEERRSLTALVVDDRDLSFC